MADLISVSEIAAERRVSLKHIYRLVGQGVFGDAVGKLEDGSLGIERSAAEKYVGHPLEPTPRTGKGRPPKADDLEAALFTSFAPADLKGICRVMAETRDREWQRYLTAKRIDVPGPAMPDELATTLTGQRWFSQQQVLELLHNLEGQIRGQWQVWLRDTLARSRFPDGPPCLNPDDLDPIK